jgi:hypothetical protein
MMPTRRQLRELPMRVKYKIQKENISFCSIEVAQWEEKEFKRPKKPLYFLLRAFLKILILM